MTSHSLRTIITATIVTVLPKVTFHDVFLKILLLAYRVFNRPSQQCQRRKLVIPLLQLSSHSNTERRKRKLYIYLHTQSATAQCVDDKH